MSSLTSAADEPPVQPHDEVRGEDLHSSNEDESIDGGSEVASFAFSPAKRRGVTGDTSAFSSPATAAGAEAASPPASSQVSPSGTGGGGQPSGSEGGSGGAPSLQALLGLPPHLDPTDSMDSDRLVAHMIREGQSRPQEGGSGPKTQQMAAGLHGKTERKVSSPGQGEDTDDVF